MNPVVIFCGPTLAREEVLEILPRARCRGPAARGDVYRACLDQPAAIGLIDGYFEHRPAVTHKEILWALSREIPVFGAASMGALRAAELHQLGMIGCGATFADLAAGRLEDDDEVAVTHAAAEHGYRAGSEAMVNMRATIAAARSAGVVSSTLARAFLECAKALFYPSRDYQRVLAELADSGTNREELATLRAWLAAPGHRVDQKRRDALEMLTTMKAMLEGEGLTLPKPDWSLPLTSAFCQLQEEVAARASSPLRRGIIEELQLLGPETYSEIVSSASLRALAVALDSTVGSNVTRPWPPPAGEASMVADEARVIQHMPRVQDLVLSEVEPVLRVLGDYERVAARAAKKADLCKDLAAPTPDEVAESIDVYFRSVLRRELPADLARFAQSVGFSSVASFAACVRRELDFLRKLTVNCAP